MYAATELTGYPSVDRPWLKYYEDGVFEKALNTPKDQSIYRFYVENVFTKPDFPLIKYFNTTLTTKQFLSLIETWARAFRAVGVGEDEMVPVYGTWSPEIAAIFFALNAIGAYPYFVKLEITEDALRTETREATVAVVHEPLWTDIAKHVFTEKHFRKVFMVGLADSMSFPLRQILRLRDHSFRDSVSDADKYIFTDTVPQLAAGYTRPFEAPFRSGRFAAITSSSGTTSSVVKGIMDTNESALANMLATVYAKPGYIPGKECFVTLPPTASTALNCFFLLPLCSGMTVRIDPRADEESWTKLLLKYRPSLSISTGSLWHVFYRNISKGRHRLPFADAYIMGGSGVTPEQLQRMNETAEKQGAPHRVVSGYGCSEFFGVVTVDKYDTPHKTDNGTVISVGIPIPGIVMAVFDEDGNELPYGERGEICIQGPSRMHGYYGKPELSAQMLRGEWLKTGDIGLMDADGYLYLYGRKKSSVTVNGQTVYLFDIANRLRTKLGLEDSMAEAKKLADGSDSVVVYFVQKEERRTESEVICRKMSRIASSFGITVDGYREFYGAFPISPTTLKPQNRYTDGFFRYSESGEKITLEYRLTEKEDVYTKAEKQTVSAGEQRALYTPAQEDIHLFSPAAPA